MQHDPISIIRDVWVALGAVWLLMWFTNKRTAKAESAKSRFIHIALGTVTYLLLTDKIPSPFLRSQFFAPTLPVDIVGIYLAIFGALFAIWARLTIGRNWSSAVTLKEDHTLIRSGPYSIVRHPIYSGLLAALLGSVMVIGKTSSLLGLAGFACIVWWKLSREERLMIRQFGPQYLQYRHDVKALIPFLL